jgi:RsiW-degrading membrane proteinase PrsW (M82 family)
VDNRPKVRLFYPVMAQSQPKLVTPVSLLVDAVLVLVFFGYMYTVVSTHVPSDDHRMIVLWGLITSFCLTLVFWLALQMFRVVFRAQREAKGK